MRSLTITLSLATILTASTSAAVAADGAPAKLIPAVDFARQPKYSSVQFSPDGSRFAAVQLVDGRNNLTVGDLKAHKLTRITSFKTYDVGRYNWISNTRLVLSLYDAQKGLAETRGGGLFAINQDGSEPKELSPTQESCEAKLMICRQTRFVRIVPGSEDEIIAGANERDLQTEDLYRLNTRTGRKTLLTVQNPGKVSDWFLDGNNIPRAAISQEGKTLGETFWYRDNADTPWRKISSVSGEAAARIEPAAFDADGSLFVYSNLDTDRFQLREFDPKTGKAGAVVVEHPLLDVHDTPFTRVNFITERKAGFKILGVRFLADKPETAWFDEKYAKLQALMNASLPKGNENLFTVLENGKVAVFSWSDRDPGQYLLYDPEKKQLEEVLRPNDWIKPEQMAPMTVVRYKARDGLEIPAYLTLPVGKPASKLPLVAVIHGGPFGIRDEWGFEPDVQFLANRGYAVLQPNYRGSGGYGLRHYTSGFRQWGLAMQDDVTDGVRYLIAQGIVDAARVCIDGGSYGGYATLMALVKEPDLFKCGIDEAGVSDLFWLNELGYSDFVQADSAAADAFYAETVGDASKDKLTLEATSPRLQAAKIKSPLMIIHAVRDQRVPFQHAEGMRDAMRAVGKSVEWDVYSDEAHGFIKLENRLDRYDKIEAFLKKNIGQ
jgi:dipeptidyl aminopeptidase/acylaminoacyl peptidase